MGRFKGNGKSCTPMATRNLEYARTVCAWMSKERSQVSPYSQRRLNKSEIVTQTHEDTLLPALERLQCGQLLESEGKKGAELFWAELRKSVRKRNRILSRKKGRRQEKKKFPERLRCVRSNPASPIHIPPFASRQKKR